MFITQNVIQAMSMAKTQKSICWRNEENVSAWGSHEYTVSNTKPGDSWEQVEDFMKDKVVFVTVK